MRKKIWLAVPACLVLVMGASLAPAWAQDDMDEGMEAMMAAAKPNEHHENLALLAGTWKTQGKLYNPQVPDAPPQETSGRAVNKMIMDGRFLIMEYEGDFMGMPFKGLGIEGYDNLKQKHVQTWVDSLGTMVMVSEGSCSNGGKVRTVSSEFMDPMTGRMTKARQVLTVKSDDEHLWEMYTSMPDGSEFKVMEIAYRR